MKLLILLPLLFLTLIAKEQTIHSSYDDNNSTYTLTLRYHEVSTLYGKSQLIRYSVFKDGTFMHGRRFMEGADTEVGRMMSCYQEVPTIIALKTEQKQIGWMIEGNGLCGNTVSRNEEIILPQTYDYLAKRILSKEAPSLSSHAFSTDIYYFQQEWGTEGTAVSFYIPKKLTISEKYREMTIQKKPIMPQDIKYLVSHVSYSFLSFLGIFTAGMRAINPDTMKYALNHYYTPKEQEWYSYHYPNSTKTSFEEIIQHIKTAKDHLDNAWSKSKIQPSYTY